MPVKFLTHDKILYTSSTLYFVKQWSDLLSFAFKRQAEYCCF